MKRLKSSWIVLAVGILGMVVLQSCDLGITTSSQHRQISQAAKDQFNKFDIAGKNHNKVLRQR